MIPNNTQLVHQVGEVEQSLRMSIDNDSLAHLMMLLTDLYSDPILAVIREYSTNARDSHIEAGLDRPIEVTLPTSLTPSLVIRDFGVGLNVDDLRDVYSMYGKSTKRNTDEATGTLGLGCKSGLTYALSFTVTAIKEGVKTVAAITKDADGVGTIKVLDTATTSEPNGVIISIPVKSYDVARFEQKANEFFRYWRPGTVLLNGETPTLGDAEAIWVDPDIVALSVPNQSRVVMGGVPYPFDSKIPGVSIVAYVPMGSVNFTPSREALHFTTLTNSTLDTVRQFVEDGLGRTLRQQIDSASTPYDKLRVALRWTYVTKGGLKGHWSVSEYVQLGGVSAWSVHVPKNGYSARASRKDSLRLTELVVKGHIVTGFPCKGVSANHKDRLRQLGVTDALLLPEGADLTWLEGRDDVLTWDEVLDKTAKPVIVSSGIPRSKTQYTVAHKGRSYQTTQITETDAPIVYATPSSGQYLLHSFPEARGVYLLAKQVNRFCKLHPKAIPVSEYKTKQVNKLLKELTDDERIFLKMDRSKLNSLSGAKTPILDPLLQKVMTIVKTGGTDRTKKVANWHVTVPDHPEVEKLNEKYPLLTFTSIYSHYSNYQQAKEDLVFYVNSKHTSTKEDNK